MTLDSFRMLHGAMTARIRRRIVAVFLALMGVLMPLSSSAYADPLKAALVKADQTVMPATLQDLLAAELKSAGYDVNAISPAELCDSNKLSAAQVDLLVLPNAADLPAASVDPIHGYLKGGGDIIALNAPLWQRQLISDGDAWVTREEYRRKHATELLQHVLFDFTPGSIADWRRTTNDESTETVHEVVSGEPAPVANALHVTISKLTNWDTFLTPPLDRPFPEGHTLTVFYAKGGPRTTQLAVEWTEKDGSRWIATVPLTAEWQQYVLEPKDFRYWESVPARRNDQFKPENAAQLSVGLAFTHTGVSGDRHEYWVGPFGTAARTPEHEKMLTSFQVPALDTLSPGYKFFSCTDAAKLAIRPDQIFAPVSDDLPAAKTMRSPHPRPRVGGFAKGRAWRWAPIVEARTGAGDWRGSPVTLMVHADGPYKGGVWASFGIGDMDWYGSVGVVKLIGGVARSMRRGVFLVDGGSNFYTYFEGQDIVFGARVVNVGREARPDLVARVRLTDPGNNAEVRAASWDMNLAPGEGKTVSESFRLGAGATSRFNIAVELLEHGEIIDRAAHEAHVWKPKAKKSFITVENGEFMLDGKRWRAHGVNYMPSSGIGTEDGEYFEYWIGARSYDPEVIERDLTHVKALGLNAVSIFIHRQSLEAQNLLDLLRRLDEMGLKANLSLRPGTPMDFQWKEMRELIEYYRLWEHDCIFAFDLAWEPMFGDHDARREWDGAWREWIIERYGSIENAEKDWEFSAPRNEAGEVTNPLGAQTVENGPWRRMVAAYRRFLDTLLYEKYSRARRLVRSIDPNHLVSFRMAEAGNPTFRWDKAIPYDFAYLAGAVDILEPEAYGRIGDWEKVKPGWFEFEYARWAAPRMPMMWAEAGVSAWVESRMEAPPEQLQFQADFYGNLYRMFAGSGADGIFYWWYPGGYRVGERSDFGIINPDGSDRPVTKVIRANAQEFVNGPPTKTVDTWIAFDRDEHPDGIGGIYSAAKDAFWIAVSSGGTPGLKTAGTGKNSANCPLVAIGNIPYSGTNPPKYLDGFFDVVEVRNAEGKWQVVERGTAVKVQPGTPVIARLAVTNLGEATWLAPKASMGPGGVYVHVTSPIPGSGTDYCLPADLPRLGTATLDELQLAPAAPTQPTEITLTFWAADRAKFGPRFTFIVGP